MRTLAYVTALVCGCVLIGFVPSPLTTGLFAEKSATRSPASVLLESYQLSRDLTPSDRAVLLNFLCRTAAEHHLQYTAAWAEENFRMAHELPIDWNRVAIQKNALVALSYVNPQRAVSLLHSTDLPVAKGNGSLAEDVRSDGAVIIFKNLFLLRGMSGLSTIRAAATYLGETGEYPYFAIQGILLEAAKANKRPNTVPTSAMSLVLDAYSSYRRGSKFENENDEFAHFLQALKTMLPETLIKQGLELAVDRLLHDDSTLEPNLSYISRIKTEKGQATFQKRNDSILFGLLPLVREVDPAWAARIIEQNKALAQGEGNSGKLVSSQGSIVSSRPEDQSYMSDYLRLQSVSDMAQKDPDQAWRLGLTIVDPVLRATAMASIAGVIASSAPDRAKEIRSTIAAIIPNIEDANGRLSALSALAKTTSATKDTVGFRDVLDRSFTLGEELFEEDVIAHPGKPTYDVSAYNELGDVVRSGISVDAMATLSRIENVENIVLRAYLLSTYAQEAFKISGGRQEVNS